MNLPNLESPLEQGVQEKMYLAVSLLFAVSPTIRVVDGVFSPVVVVQYLLFASCLGLSVVKADSDTKSKILGLLSLALSVSLLWEYVVAA
nr:MAG: hypothetical protein J07AB56_08610 [Candidatus Nanosalinarum sp. J07AB56]